MGIKENLKAFRTGLSIAKAGLQNGNQGITASLQNLLTPKWNQPPARNTYQILDMYSKNPRMNPIRKISEDVGGAKFKLYTGPDKKKIIENHPLLDLLNNPNPMPEWTGYLTRYLTEVYMLLKGQGYWVLERNGLGMPTEIWLLPPHWIRETPSFYRPYYTVQPLGVSTLGVMYIPQEDVIHFKDPNPLDPYARGIGQAEGIADEIETDEFMAKYAKRFFYNDATPPFVVTAPGAQEEEIDRMEQRWIEKHGGYNKSHGPAFMNWEANIQILKETNREMEYIESRRFLRDLCNQHFNVPPEILGINENSNRATIGAAEYIYSKNVLVPKFRLVEDTVNTQLCPMYKDKPYFEFDNVVPDDKEFELTKANAGVTNSTIMVDEWRKVNGMEELPNGQGQVLMVKVGVQPTKPQDLQNFQAGRMQQQNNNNNQQEDNQEDAGKMIKSLTKIQRKAVAKAIQKKNATRIKDRDKLSKPLEDEFEEAMKSYLNDMKNDVIAKVKQGAKNPINTGKWDKELENRVKPLYEKIFKAGGQSVVDEFKGYKDIVTKDSELDDFDVFFDFKDPAVSKMIKSKLMKIKNINQTTKDNVADLIQEAYESDEGFSINQITKQIDEMPDFDQARARTIAQTETLSSLNIATSQAYVQNKDLIDGKAWLSNGDSKTRPAHLQASMDYTEDSAIPVDDYFTVGGEDCLCPGDESLSAENVVNCRCCMAPVVKID
ncbi:MAG: phage portal protein [Bacillota bacterium]|nr:phage portal protein [Bacillota bacterium]